MLGKYVRDDKILSLEQAVRKLSGLPATNLGLDHRGFVQEGMFADVVVFDPATIGDRGDVRETASIRGGHEGCVRQRHASAERRRTYWRETGKSTVGAWEDALVTRVTKQRRECDYRPSDSVRSSKKISANYRPFESTRDSIWSRRRIVLPDPLLDGSDFIRIESRAPRFLGIHRDPARNRVIPVSLFSPRTSNAAQSEGARNTLSWLPRRPRRCNASRCKTCGRLPAAADSCLIVGDVVKDRGVPIFSLERSPHERPQGARNRSAIDHRASRGDPDNAFWVGVTQLIQKRHRPAIAVPTRIDVSAVVAPWTSRIEIVMRFPM